MKIAINTLSENPYAPSGAFGFYQNLIREMSKFLGDDILYIFVSRSGDTFFGPYENPNIRKIVFKYSNEKKWLRVLTEHLIFPFIILKHKINVLDTGTSILYCPCKLVATMKTMHVYTNPDTIPLLTKLYRKFTYKLTKWNAMGIISNSKSQTSDIKKYTGINEDKIHIVYEAIDHDTFYSKNNKEGKKQFMKKYGISKPFILFVSSFYPYKNAETLIKAYSNLNQRNNYQLVLVGFPRNEEYFTALMRLVEELKIGQDVVFTGGVKQKDTAKFYQSAEIFVYPSKYETFGLTILEAMACNCPVITSGVSAMPEIGGGAAIYFEPENHQELITKIEFLLENPREKNKICAKGLKRAARFTWLSTGANTLKVLREVESPRFS